MTGSKKLSHKKFNAWSCNVCASCSIRLHGYITQWPKISENMCYSCGTVILYNQPIACSGEQLNCSNRMCVDLFLLQKLNLEESVLNRHVRLWIPRHVRCRALDPKDAQPFESSASWVRSMAGHVKIPIVWETRKTLKIMKEIMALVWLNTWF